MLPAFINKYKRTSSRRVEGGADSIPGNVLGGKIIARLGVDYSAQFRVAVDTFHRVSAGSGLKLLHRHLVLGQSTRFVRADDSNRAERLDCR